MKDLIINCQGTNYLFVEGCYFIVESETRKDKCTITKIDDEKVHVDVEVLSSGEVLTYKLPRKTFIDNTVISFKRFKVAFTPLLTTYPH